MPISRAQIILLVLIALVAIFLFSRNATAPEPTLSSTPQPTQSPASPTPEQTTKFQSPIDNARARVTKKLFGIYVTPNNSPTIPEHFTGYHTATDFEIFSGEENKDIEVRTICAGKLVKKSTAEGYGGVLAQSCTNNGQPVVIIYGHLKLSSVTVVVGNELQAGQRLGILGAAFTSETGNERKHLHLGIHKGLAINIRGYVQSQAELSDWIDPLTLIP